MPNYRRIARKKARKYNINPRYFSRQIRAESNFDPGARSPAGAAGIAQIMPATARSWHVNPLHPRAALDAAARNMATYLRQFHGSWAAALTAYNAGPGAVGHSLPAETRNYIAKIVGGGPDRQGVSPRHSHPNGGGGPLFGFKADRLKLQNKSVFDQQGFQRAQAGALIGQLIASHRGTESPLFKSGLLSTTAPSRADFMSQQLTSKVIPGGGVRKVGHAPGGGGGGAAIHDSSVQGMLARAEAWDRAKVHYQWGGGHGSSPARPGTPVDCSGYVSAILGISPRVSSALAHWGRPGRGRTVTVYANAGHVLINIGHRWYATSHSNPGGGAGQIARPSGSYLSAFTPRHPRGL